MFAPIKYFKSVSVWSPGALAIERAVFRTSSSGRGVNLPLAIVTTQVW